MKIEDKKEMLGIAKVQFPILTIDQLTVEISPKGYITAFWFKALKGNQIGNYRISSNGKIRLVFKESEKSKTDIFNMELEFLGKKQEFQDLVNSIKMQKDKLAEKRKQAESIALVTIARKISEKISENEGLIGMPLSPGQKATIERDFQGEFDELTEKELEKLLK